MTTRSAPRAWRADAKLESRKQAHPDALRSRFPEMHAPKCVPGHHDGHRLIVFLADHPKPRRRPQVPLVEKFEKQGIFLVDAQNFVGAARFRLRKPHGSKLPAQTRHSAKQRHAVRAAAVAPEAFEQQANNLRRHAVLEMLRFFVGAGPFEADYVGKQLFRQPMAKDKM